jgi:Pterin 4 alpha carbinolamine dehydratase
MTETLAEKKCTPCRGGIPPLTHEEAERFQSQTPNWELRDDAHRIERTFRFRDFQEALGCRPDSIVSRIAKRAIDCRYGLLLAVNFRFGL